MIEWETRGEGSLSHQFHRLTESEVDDVSIPATSGVHEFEIAGEKVYTWVLHTPMISSRPLRALPVVYRTREDAETHGEIWATRDREIFYAERSSS